MFTKLTVFTVLHELLIDEVPEFGVAGEPHPIPGHREPGTHGEQHAVGILAHQIFKHCGVVNEGVQFPANSNFNLTTNKIKCLILEDVSSKTKAL